MALRKTLKGATGEVHTILGVDLASHPLSTRIRGAIKSMRNERRKWASAFLIVLTVVVAGGTAFYFYSQYSSLKKNPQEFAQREVKGLIERVSELIVLPEGEEPTVATVSDVEKLKDQPFFVRAKQGYKVIIYTQAKKAILYDPAAHKIVEVAPLNIPANP